MPGGVGHAVFDTRFRQSGFWPLYKEIGKIPKFTFAGSFLEGHFLFNERVHSHKIWHTGRKSHFQKIFSAHLRGALSRFWVKTLGNVEFRAISKIPRTVELFKFSLILGYVGSYYVYKTNEVLAPPIHTHTRDYCFLATQATSGQRFTYGENRLILNHLFAQISFLRPDFS